MLYISFHSCFHFILFLVVFQFFIFSHFILFHFSLKRALFRFHLFFDFIGFFMFRSFLLGQAAGRKGVRGPEVVVAARIGKATSTMGARQGPHPTPPPPIHPDHYVTPVRQP